MLVYYLSTKRIYIYDTYVCYDFFSQFHFYTNEQTFLIKPLEYIIGASVKTRVFYMWMRITKCSSKIKIANKIFKLRAVNSISGSRE